METKTIYERLLNAQKKIEPVTKDANNPFFKSSYATLGQVIATVKDILNDEGIIIVQPIMDNKVYTILMGGPHLEEQIKDGGTDIICSKPNDPQAQGSAITYARRYGLMSLLCLSAEDDDGEKATTHASPTPVKQTIPSQPANLGSCPKCKSPLVSGVQKSTGKEYLKCSTAKWDAATKTSSGCDFFKWKTAEPQDIPDLVLTDEVMEQISQMPF